jgi:hypothetical protein
MDLQQLPGDPIERFDNDISDFIQHCLQAGEQIILGIDVNEDVRHGSFGQKMKQLGLIEICTSHHGNYAPPTFARGSIPIDAIFVTPSLDSSRCGYLPVVSDHRVLWVDVPQQSLFGSRLSLIPTRTPQRLSLQDPRVVAKYISSVESQFREANLLSRLLELQSQMDTHCSEQLIAEYNQIDALRVRCILQANKSCRHLKMGQVAYSPTLVMAWNKIRAWKLVRRKLAGGRVDSRYLRRELKFANIKDISLVTLSEAEEKLAQAWKEYRRLKKQASSLRATWIEGLAAARLADGKGCIAQELKNLLTRERQRNEARFIKHVLKPNGRTGLHSIEIVNDSGEVVEITDQEGIEEALLAELKKRFNQAATTPFLDKSLLSDVGPLGVSPASQEILAGKYVPSNSVDEWASKLLPFLKRIVPTIPTRDLLPHEYASSWKKVKERTSSGPSGLTIPHMKAHGQSNLLTRVDSIMANLPFRHGFSPTRWRKGLDVMIEKKPGARRLDSLRAILLYEADFNQNNKRLGREMLYQAEIHDAVAVEQYGSRKNMSASDQSLNKALTFDIWRQLRQRGALCCNDAKACYDRIVHNCASLCMQRVGTDPHPIISMFQTIQSLEHHVRTVFGESKKFFKQAGTTPLQGVGQGNGAGPQIWALVSTPVLNMLRSQGLGATFVSALSRKSTTLVGFAFVDDTDLVTSGPGMTLEDVKSRIQESLIAWEGGIRATGGAIEPRKSHWYLVDFDWNAGEPVYKQIQATGGELRVRDLNGTLQTLKHMEPWEAERTLGVRLAPDGNMQAQFEWMMQTARAWADKLRAGHLPRHLTWLAWNSTIQKTLEYPLPTTTLTKAQCDKLTSTLAQAALPRIGVLRTFPRALLHAPNKMAGLDVPNLYTEQGVAHILRLIRYSKSKQHSTGLLLRHTCEALKIELGTNGFLLSNPWELSILATDSWIKSTWEFAIKTGITIQDDLLDFRPIRFHDQLLIPLFCKLGFHGSSLRLLNQCRLFLRVSWLSEIVTADGRQIEKSVLEGPYALSIQVQFLYPAQTLPPESSWRVWRDALSRLCADRNVLLKPLGPYLCDDWIRWWSDEASNRLYQRNMNNTFDVFRKTIGKRTRSEQAKYTFSHTESSCPSSAVPATARQSSHVAYLTGIGSWSPAEFPSLDHFGWIFDNVSFPPNLESELDCAGTIQAVSDGSFKASHGTAAWMAVISSVCIIYGLSVSPGEASDQSAYRSELTGLYGIAMTIRHLERKFSFRGKVIIGCDGLSALTRASFDCDFTNPNEPQFDLITAIRQIRQESLCQWCWKHIKGHQDDVRPTHELDQWSKWNIEMDTAAKLHWKKTNGSSFAKPLFGEPWRTIVAGKKLVSNMRQELRHACNVPPALDHWRKKNRFGQFIPEAIDWDSFGMAITSIPTPRKHWICKTVSGFCSTGRMMKRRKERETDACPRCGEPEDVEHVWRCQHHTDSLWAKSLEDLRRWLDSNDSHPDITKLIIEGLSRWRTGDTTPICVSGISWIQELERQQNRCGWRNFFEGFLISDWHDAVKQYLARLHSRKSPRRWISALIRKMWLIAWDLWEHRNGFLHDKECSILVSQLDSQITAQFAIGATLLDPATRVLFKQGLKCILDKPLEVKQQWVRRVLAARDNVALGNNDRYSSERATMSRWLGLQR